MNNNMIEPLKFYPLRKHPITVDLADDIDDGFGSAGPRYVVDAERLVWEQWVVRPGKFDSQVIGYIPEWLEVPDVED